MTLASTRHRPGMKRLWIRKKRIASAGAKRLERLERQFQQWQLQQQSCQQQQLRARKFAEENHHPLFNFPRMYGAYLACRRNKRNKLSALAFEVNFEENLICLVEELREMRYRPATSICFYTRKPKAREIFAADFRDRIVHHLVYQAIAPKWERIFIHHSYACRPQKGTHRAANALQGFLRKITQNGSRRAFYLKMDIKNFFMSVDRLRLFEILVKHHHNRSLL